MHTLQASADRHSTNMMGGDGGGGGGALAVGGIGSQVLQKLVDAWWGTLWDAVTAKESAKQW